MTDSKNTGARLRPSRPSRAALPSCKWSSSGRCWDQHCPRRPHRNRNHIEASGHSTRSRPGHACTADVRKMLLEAGAKHSKIKTSVGRSAQTLLMPGTTLNREWDEREYRVTVTPDGLYALDGQVFKSLSAAARHITGTRWNGPKFFGLRGGKGDGQ